MERKKRQKKSERRNRMTKKQQDYLIEFLAENRDMVTDRGLYGTSKLWTEVTKLLNKIGTKKSTEDWIEAYKLLTRKIRLKHKRCRSDPLKFTIRPIEQKLLTLEGILPPVAEPADPISYDVKEENADDEFEPENEFVTKLESSSPLPGDSISMGSSRGSDLFNAHLQTALENSTRELCSAIRSLGDSIVLAAKIIAGKEK